MKIKMRMRMRMKNLLLVFLVLILSSGCGNIKHHPAEKMIDLLITQPDKINNSLFAKANPSSAYHKNSIEEWKRYFKSYNGDYELLAYPLNRHFKYNRYFAEYFDEEGNKVCAIKILHKPKGYGSIFYFKKIEQEWVYDDIQFFGTVQN